MPTGTVVRAARAVTVIPAKQNQLPLDVLSMEA